MNNRDNPFIHYGWVRGKTMETIKGFTENSLKKMRSTGKLIEGSHWKKWNNVIVYHFERIDEFIEHGT